MVKSRFLRGILSAIGVVMLLSGCSLTYAVKEPVLSSIDYGRKDMAPLNMTVIDERTGSDAVFLAKMLGIKGSGSESITLTIENISDPVGYLANQLERELGSRGIPVKCAVGKTAGDGMTLRIKRYQIINIRATGFSPWEACHVFSGIIVNNGRETPIKAYFYNGKTPVWSMKEIEEPCFTIPISVMVKEIASKINSAVFQLQASDEKVNALTAEINAAGKKENKDPYLRPFWQVLDLGFTNNPKALEPLKIYAQDPDEFFKSCALSAIGTLGAKDELQFLVGQYMAGSYNDKYMAAKSIGDIGTPDAMKFLQGLKQTDAYKSEGGLKNCLDLYVP